MSLHEAIAIPCLLISTILYAVGFTLYMREGKGRWGYVAVFGLLMSVLAIHYVGRV